MKTRTFTSTLMLLVLAFYANLVYSQAPQGISYQAVIRDSDGKPVASKNIGVRLTLENISGVAYYTETHSPTSTKEGVITLNIGNGAQVGINTFANIPWKDGDIYVKIEIDPAGGNTYTPMGTHTKLQSVPYALYANNTKEVVSQPNATDDEPIFVVKNKEGKIVFAVYQTGVRVYVEDTPLKGAKGGFAVGGLSNQAKGNVEYLRITSDSARIFVNEVSGAKGAKGGFAVGGLSNQAKGSITRNLMFVAPDSTRFYIDDLTTLKGAKGGFAVGGLSNQAKGGTYDILKVTSDSTRIYVSNSSTKGAKGGFAVGGLSNQSKTGTSNNFMFIGPDSARIYIDDSKTIKGAKGGFAVGGLSNQAKGGSYDLLKVTTDSTRIYVSNNSTKGAKGGFAVGGLSNQSKAGTNNNLMFIGSDSARIYIDDSTTPKGAKGGFAVGGLSNQAKGGSASYFNVSTNSTGNIYPSEKRVMWYPLKNAFLAGQVIIEMPDSVGVNSFATGFESKAKGNYSQALGFKAIARGQYSTAIGYQALAHKNNSFAFGYQAKATSDDSYAFGSGAQASGNKSFAFGSVGIDSTGNVTGNTKASGDYAYAFGLGSIASGKASLAFGANNIASGSFATAIGYKTNSGNWYSTAMGGYTTASGFYTVAMGFKTTASGIASCAFGNQSTASGVYSFACGDNAKALGARSVALGAFSNAQGAYSFAVGYSSITGPSATAATALGRETNASATYSTAIGYQSASSGIYSLAGGNVSTASGISSIALGDHASASANYSIALGRNVVASTQYAIAIGNTTTASGDNSTAFGNQTSAIGKYSLSVGYGCTANAYSSTAVGAYNVVEGTPGSWIATDPIFAVGNGTSSSSLSNAVTVYKDGTMKLKSNFYPELPAATLGTSGNKWNTVFATNGTINTSDLRLKDNITELTYGLAELLKLKPVSFLWKKSPQEGRKLGFIAQDVKPIISEVVVEGDDPDKTLGINYSSIIPVIVKGMQEQQRLIDNQKQQINELMEANKRLLERVEKLETLNK
ncbi:MAG: tail fiber domain-containing protein [Bacteroidales bacterium]|nr:tail fiber domain-containing protein [Bacteroidales bacterium]